MWQKLLISSLEMLATKVLIPWLASILGAVKDKRENGKEKIKAEQASKKLKEAIDEKQLITAIDNLP